MSVYLLNSVKVATPTTGTGSVTVGAAEPGYLTPAEAGAVNGRVYTWRLDDGDDFEIFRGTYSSSGPTVSRDAVLVSKVSGVVGTSKLNLSGSASLSCVPVAQWMQAPYVQNINDGPLGGFRNKLINGDGRINQRGASSVADDAYGHDRHYVLTQTGNVTVSTLTAPADGIASMMRLTQPSGTAKRMGYAQIIEATETYGLRGKTVTLGGKLRCSSATPIRFAILEWTGTPDQVTSDVVNNWNSTNYTPGNFFISSSLTVAAVGSITPGANTITDWNLTATISPSVNNIIVFYWTQNTVALNTSLDMRWYLVEGDATAEDDPFSPRHIQQELALCQRYFQTGEAENNIGIFNQTDAALIFSPFRVQMRAAPTCTLASGSTISIDAFGEGTSTSSSFILTGNIAGIKIDVNSLSPTRTRFNPAQCLSRIFASAEL